MTHLRLFDAMRATALARSSHGPDSSWNGSKSAHLRPNTQKVGGIFSMNEKPRRGARRRPAAPSERPGARALLGQAQRRHGASIGARPETPNRAGDEDKTVR